MNELTPYGEWSPTQFDCKGLGDVPGDWLVCPVLVTRDTPEHSIDASNYATLLKMLEEADPDGNDHQEHSFNHWGPGWFDIIVVRPESKCAGLAQESADAMADYPLLDEEDHSRREYEEACRYWESMDIRERWRYITESAWPDRLPSIFCVRRKSPYDLPEFNGDWPDALIRD